MTILRFERQSDRCFIEDLVDQLWRKDPNSPRDHMKYGFLTGEDQRERHPDHSMHWIIIRGVWVPHQKIESHSLQDLGGEVESAIRYLKDSYICGVLAFCPDSLGLTHEDEITRSLRLHLAKKGHPNLSLMVYGNYDLNVTFIE
jgi:hypothetical protein